MHHVHAFANRGHKKAQNPLVANYFVGAGDQTLVLCGANKGFLIAEPVLQPTFPVSLKVVSLHAFQPSAAAGAGWLVERQFAVGSLEQTQNQIYVFGVACYVEALMGFFFLMLIIKTHFLVAIIILQSTCKLLSQLLKRKVQSERLGVCHLVVLYTGHNKDDVGEI